MSDLISAAKQALEALQNITNYEGLAGAREMLRQVIEQAEKQSDSVEPVAWELGAEVYWNDSPALSDYIRKEGTPLYTHPQPKAEQVPVAVKHMMEWVTLLKARSDNGQHMQIPSNLSAGACWDLACELEQFIKASPQPQKPLTDKQLNIIGSRWHLNLLGADEKSELFAFARAIEAAHNIKE